VAEALAKSGVKLVPDIVAGGGASGGTLVGVLLANVIREGTLRSVPAARLGTSSNLNTVAKLVEMSSRR
jgi:hypothetical protein